MYIFDWTVIFKFKFIYKEKLLVFSMKTAKDDGMAFKN